MATEKINTKPNDLDKSIDLGLDQFGRFVRARWPWLLLLGIVIWYFIVYLVPQLSPPTPSVLFSIALQIGFAVLFVGVQFFMWFYFMGRPRLYWVMPGETGVNFADYKGNPEVLETATRIVALLRGVEEFEKMGGKPVRGLLLAGPPGTGKSYLAQCISTEAGVPFAYASAASLRGIFMGMGVLAVKNIYRKARRLAREYGGCIIFLDEIDAIGTSRQNKAPQMGFGGGGMMGMMGDGTLNELLMQMDPPNIETGWFKKVLRVLGLYHSRVQSQPVLTIGATNIVDTLDAALLRPGRFDRKITVNPPTDRYRPEVIEFYLNKVKHEENISLTALSARFVDYTPVAIKHVINESAILAHFAGREKVTYPDIVEAQEIHEHGLRQTSDLTEIDRRRIAYHEAGHTVASYYLYDRAFPAYVTMHTRGDLDGAVAYAQPRLKESIKTHSKQDLEARMQVALAARAAEEIFLNVQLSGVTGDLQSATQMATLYVGHCAMDGTLSSWEVTGAQENERVERVLQHQFRAVKKLLQDHSEALISLAEALMAREELVAEEIKEIIDEADARQVAKTLLKELQPLLSNDRQSNNGHNGHASNGNGRAQSNGASKEIPQRGITVPLNFSLDSSPNNTLPD